MADFSKLKKAVRTKVDFTDAGDRGPFNPVHQEEGDYLFKIVAVLDSPTKETKEPQWIFAFQDTERSNAVYPYRCKLDKQNAWKIRNVFEAVGIKVPQKMMNVDPQKVVGKLIGATLEDNEYNGKVKSQVGDVFSPKDFDGDDTDADDQDDADEVEEDEEEEAAPPKKAPKSKAASAKKAAPKKKPAPEPEEDEDEEEEVEDGDDDELEVEDL